MIKALVREAAVSVPPISKRFLLLLSTRHRQAGEHVHATPHEQFLTFFIMRTSLDCNLHYKGIRSTLKYQKIRMSPYYLRFILKLLEVQR